MVEGFVKAIEDAGNNGKALLVSEESIDYYNLPGFEAIWNTRKKIVFCEVPNKYTLQIHAI